MIELQKNISERIKFTIPNEPDSPFLQQLKKILASIIDSYTGTKQNFQTFLNGWVLVS